MRRVDCRRCGVVSDVPWGDGKRTLTKAYMLFLASLGAAAVMERDGRGLSNILGQGFRRVRTCRHRGLEHRTPCQIDAIGVDEIQYSKGYKYLPLVYQIDLGVTRLLWIGKERTIRILSGILHHDGRGNHIKDRLHLLRRVGAVLEGHP
jgi:hypothetical protein